MPSIKQLFPMYSGSKRIGIVIYDDQYKADKSNELKTKNPKGYEIAKKMGLIENEDLILKVRNGAGYVAIKTSKHTEKLDETDIIGNDWDKDSNVLKDIIKSIYNNDPNAKVSFFF